MSKTGFFYIFFLIIIFINGQNLKAQKCLPNIESSFSYVVTNNGCGSPQTISFSNTSTGTQAGFLTYFWKINNTFFDTTTGLTNPSALTKTTGNYSVHLIVKSTSGCWDTFTSTISIFQTPHAVFTANPASFCEGSPVYVTNNSTGKGVNTSFYWDFGDGYKITSGSNIFYHVYSATGTYTIKLVQVNGTGCADSVSHTITVSSGGWPVEFYDDLSNPQFFTTWKRCVTLVTEPDSFRQTFVPYDTLINYTIDFGDGTSISGDTILPGTFINHLYLHFGTYNFTVTCNHPGSCSTLFFGQFVNLRNPIAGIGGPSGGQETGCLPAIVPFKNTSSFISPNTIFTWNWGDGTIDIFDSSNVGDSVVHTYLQSACALSVSLQAQNECGFSTSTWSTVNIYAPDIVTVTPKSVSLCYPDTTVTFVAQISYNCYPGQRKHYWDFGDGTNSGWLSFGGNIRTHHFPGPGTYHISYRDSNACGKSNIDSATVIIFRPPHVNISLLPNAHGCTPFTVHFTNNSTGNGLSYSWNFGDGSTSTAKSPTHTYLLGGYFTIKLFVLSPVCNSDDTSISIHVNRKQKAGFDVINNGCKPILITYHNTTQFATSNIHYLWKLGNGDTSTQVNPLPEIFNSSGTYTVKLYAYDTCGTDSFTRTFIIYKNPVANFKADTVCYGSITHFTNVSSIDTASGNIVNFYWDFGDGDTSSLTSPAHSYLSKGTYNARLVAKSSFGCVDTFYKNVIVNEVPSVSFTASPGFHTCNISRFYFYGQVAGSTAIDSFTWNFGDGAKGRGSDTVNHLYSNGTYVVGFKVINSAGCSASDSNQITAYSSPIAGFTADSVCYLMDSTSFTDHSSTINHENLINWYWDFNNDGITDDTRADPKHLFTTFGPLNVRLVIKTQYGCYDTINKNIMVFQNPVVSIIPNFSSICAGDSAVFHNHSILADTFTWSFGDGSSSLKRNDTFPVKHRYNVAGNYYVSLNAKSKYGCISQDSIMIVVRALPVAHFFSNDTASCTPFLIHFNNNSLFASSYKWYSDGVFTNNTVTKPDTTLNLPGDTLMVKLIAYSSFGCASSAFTQRYFTFNNPKSAFSFSPHKGCGPLTVHFTNNSLNSLHYIWKFGDGTTSTLASPVHNFLPSLAKDTFYIVRLSSYSLISCTDSASDTVLVYPQPLSSFSASASSACAPGMSVAFTNHSLPYDSGTINNMTFLWNFDNGRFSNAKDTSVKFSGPPTKDSFYNISLIAFNKHHCADTSFQLIRIYHLPAVSFTVNSPSGCGPLNVVFTNHSTTNDTGHIGDISFLWKFGNGDTSHFINTSEIFKASFSKDTLYHVHLYGTSVHLCRDTDSVTIRIFPKPLALYAVDQNIGCGPLKVAFTNHSTPKDTGTIANMHFLWSFGNGISSKSQDTSVLFIKSLFSDTVYHVSLIAFNEHNCSDTSANNITVHSSPFVDFTPNNAAGCGPMVVSFNNISHPKGGGSINSMTFKWYFGNGITSNSTDTAINFIPAVTEDTVYHVKLRGVNNTSCSDSVIHNILVYPRPTVNFTVNRQNGCGPLNVNFTNHSVPNDSGSVMSMSFLWNLGDGTNGTQVNENRTYLASLTKDTVYLVTLTGHSEHNCVASMSQNIRVYPNPEASYSQSQDSGCSPLYVTFSNHSVPNDTGHINIMTFLWKFGDGSTSVLTNPLKAFLSSPSQNSTRNITLYAYSEHGCIDSAKSSVFVYVKPTVSFFQNISSACNPQLVQFVNLSIPHGLYDINDMSFLWNFGNGISSSAKDTNVYYFVTQNHDTTFNISLTGIAPDGCKDTFKSQMNIHPKPHADYSFPLNDCKGNISFTDLSNSFDALNRPMNYYWTFDNIRTSNLKNNVVFFPSSYTQDSIYHISLVVTNAFGCKDTSVKNLTVHPSPFMSFTAAPVVGCGSFNVIFSNHSTMADSVYWNFGDGNKSRLVNPSHIFSNMAANPVTYHTSLSGLSHFGCPADTAVANITVHPFPAASFSSSVDSGCSPLTVYFSNTSTNADTFFWSLFNNITVKSINASFTFPENNIADTVYKIRLVAKTNFGCADTVFKNISIFKKPLSLFSLNPVAGCAPLSVSFSNISKGAASYYWDFNDGYYSPQTNPVHVFNNSSANLISYNIKLYSTSGHLCSDTLAENVTVSPKPNVIFSSDKSQGCSPLSVKFTNHSSAIIDSFTWNFGNGLITHKKDTSVIFYSAATHDSIYNVSLTGVTQSGCSDTFTVQIKAFAMPVANFTFPDTNCGNSLIQFINKSIPNDRNSINSMSFLWDFKNIKFSNSKDEKVVFTPSNYSDSLYKITLTATNTYGCTDSSARSIIIHPKPGINFTASPVEGCGDMSVTFTSKSTLADTLKWYFGDGSLSGQTNPVHTYTNLTGTIKYFSSKLFGISHYGCPGDTAYKTIILHPHPVAVYTTSDSTGCGPMAVSFLNSSINANSYLWLIEKNITSTNINITHVFQPSIYSDTVFKVSLIAFTSIGCTDTITKNILVYRKPQALFTPVPPSGCTPLSITFNNNSTGTAGYFWEFGNGGISNNKNPTEIYINYLLMDVTFNIVLIATSSNGCQDTLIEPVIIAPRPVARYSVDKMAGCAPLTVNFTDQSVMGTSYFWNFGDGTTSNTKNPSHVFAGGNNDSIYNVMLITTGAGNCSDTFTENITVYSKVKAGFNTKAIGCIPLTVQFRDSSLNENYSMWDFDDGGISTQKNPVHTFNSIGVYSIHLHITNYAGCTSDFEITDAIKVISEPTVNFKIDRNYSELPNTTFYFTDLNDTTFIHLWEFGDHSISNITNPIHTYADSGIYKITLIINNGYCNDSTDKIIEIQTPLPTPDFSYFPDNGCVPLNVNFSPVCKYTNNYNWYFGDGYSSQDSSPTHFYTMPGVYTVTLVAGNVRGTNAKTKKNLITVYPKPFLNFVAEPDIVYLPDPLTTLINLSIGSNKYWWYLNNVFFDTAKSPTIRLFEAGEYHIKLIAKSDEGCYDTLEKDDLIRVDSAGIVIVPNSFSPNGDGYNDIFIPVGSGYYPGNDYGSGNPNDADYDPRLDPNSPFYDAGYKPKGKIYNFQVYDRWGEKIFETNNNKKGWDGKYKGKDAELGTYYWMLTVTYYSGIVKKLNGIVTLIR